jgi:hypothetical protein
MVSSLGKDILTAETQRPNTRPRKFPPYLAYLAVNAVSPVSAVLCVLRVLCGSILRCRVYV